MHAAPNDLHDAIRRLTTPPIFSSIYSLLFLTSIKPTIYILSHILYIQSILYLRPYIPYKMPQVLLLGGHGKIALYLTPLLLARAWSVTSVVRSAEHESEILKLGEGHPGKISVLLSSLDDIKTQADAQAVLDKVRPEYVVWAAGKPTYLI